MVDKVLEKYPTVNMPVMSDASTARFGYGQPALPNVSTDPYGGVLRKDHRRFRGVTEAEKAQQITASIVDPTYLPKPKAAPAAQASVDPYADGGDGRVAREGRPRNQQVSVAGGVPRDELIRRMEIAARSYAGSPSARAAMMGAYGEQLKAYDTVEINNNQNNNQNDQLTFKQNSEGNRQEAQGRQAFGNDMGILNRKGAIELAVAKANMKPVDPEMRAAELAYKQAQTKVLGLNAAGKSDLDIGADYAQSVAAARAVLGPNATPEEVDAKVQDQRAAAGKVFHGSDQLRMRSDAQMIKDMANQPTNFGGFISNAMSQDPNADVNAGTSTGGRFPEGVAIENIKETTENSGFWNAADRFTDPYRWGKPDDVTLNFGGGFARRFPGESPEVAAFRRAKLDRETANKMHPSLNKKP